MPNRLIREKSPYLLQHAHNPVDWFPWGEEAFARARAGEKPIFLSIGYSTCHWCHVMEEESFASAEIADLLNAHYVSIKVDREERPDVDRVYMRALQTMGENGGWPMSMFLTPELEPFFGGTYFPPVARHGRVGFADLLRRVNEVWREDREKVRASAAALLRHLREQQGPGHGDGALPARAAADLCFRRFAQLFDPREGGFGGPPRFPRPAVLTFLHTYSALTRTDDALGMSTATLRAMAAGGINDHLGGGFHRYSTDGAWRVPHFEKMLYDQAQIVQALLDAYLLTGDHGYARVVHETIGYVLRDLLHEEGGFCSAEDADSVRPDNPAEKGEGAFYVWTMEEIGSILGSEAPLFCAAYGVEAAGNASVDPHGEFRGRNILYRAASDEECARTFNLTPREVAGVLETCRRLLLEVRGERPRPLRDDKVIASWNGLMIGACARAGAVLGEPAYTAAAERAARFVLTHLRDPAGGGLLRRYRSGEARHPAQLEDHAFLTAGILELYGATGKAVWLREAVDLTEAMVLRFAAEDGRGFYDTDGTDASVLVRTAEDYDGAEPAGRSVAVLNLLTLAHVTGREEWRDLAEKTIAAAGRSLEEHPHGMPLMAAALMVALEPPGQVVLTGRAGEEDMEALLRVVRRRYMPGTAVVVKDTADATIATLAPYTSGLVAVGGRATAYVCRNYVCALPVTDPAALAEQLPSAPRRGAGTAP